MKKLTRENLEKARENYLKHEVKPPRFLNLKYSNSKGWDVIYHSSRESFAEGETHWLDDEAEVLALFFSCDPESIYTDSWNEDWNDD